MIRWRDLRSVFVYRGIGGSRGFNNVWSQLVLSSGDTEQSWSDWWPRRDRLAWLIRRSWGNGTAFRNVSQVLLLRRLDFQLLPLHLFFGLWRLALATQRSKQKT